MTHPEHQAFQSSGGGPYTVAKPMRGSWLVQAQVEVNCMANGGHWWHPEVDGMIDWFCCICGAETEGLPEDGTGNPRVVALFAAKIIGIFHASNPTPPSPKKAL